MFKRLQLKDVRLDTYRDRRLFIAFATVSTTLISLTACFTNRVPNYGPYGRFESAAPTYIGTFNRAQQAYFLENPTFTSSFEDLRLSWSPNRLESEHSLNYRYIVKVEDESVFISAIPRHADFAYRQDSLGFFSWKTKIERPMTAYVGGVFIIKNSDGVPQATKGIICRSNQPGITSPPAPSLQASEPTCNIGTEQIGSS